MHGPEPLQAETRHGKPRCQARVAFGSIFGQGKYQCSKSARPEKVFCKTHIKQRASNSASLGEIEGR